MRMLLICLLVVSRTAAAAPTIVKAAHVYDGDHPRDNVAILVENDRITAVAPPQELIAKHPDAKVIDLGGATVLPGLIDAHTHVFLDDDMGPGVYDAYLLKQSTPYRAIAAAANAKKALDYGFTSLRDLETEGAMYADVDVKTAIARGIVPGPRMTVATRALAPTGMYPLAGRGYDWELAVPIGVQTIDGAEQARKAVREEVGYGADWIKLYADHGPYATGRADRPVRSIVNFTPAEAAAIVDEAHRLGIKVAAHANGWDGIDSALRAGVDSIEHGSDLNQEAVDYMKSHHVVLVPTVHVAIASATENTTAPAGSYGASAYSRFKAKQLALKHEASFALALKNGVTMAAGSDNAYTAGSTGVFAELVDDVAHGMTPKQALVSATLEDATLLGFDNLGKLAPGMEGNFIAVDGDPLSDIHAIEKVRMVVFKGKVVTDKTKPTS